MIASVPPPLPPKFPYIYAPETWDIGNGTGVGHVLDKIGTGLAFGRDWRFWTGNGHCKLDGYSQKLDNIGTWPAFGRY